MAEYNLKNIKDLRIKIQFSEEMEKEMNTQEAEKWLRGQLIAFAQWLAHEEEYGKDGAIGAVDAYLESSSFLIIK